MENTLKRRHPYYHEDSPPELVLQDLSQPLSSGLDTASLPPDGRYIRDPSTSTSVTITVPLSTLLDLGCQDNQHYLLEQASSFLRVPVTHLLDLSLPQHHPHKRQRLGPSTSMFNPYQDDPTGQDGEEKAPLASPPGRLGGWTPTRIAGCMAGFAMCPPCSTYDTPTTFEPLPTVSPFDYDGGRQVLDGPVVSLQSQSQTQLCPAPIPPGQSELFPCDDAAMVAQFPYLANYPPLQPTRVMAMQPPANREEMVYPTSIPTEGPNAPDLGIRDQSHTMRPPTGAPNVVPGPYDAEVDSPPFARHGGYIGYPPRYESMSAYEIKADPDDLDMHGGSNALDVFPQRTLPARRGPFKDFDQRERTARTRKIGSCIRCRMQRIRCNLDPDDEKGPCISCKKIAANSRVYRLNCLRWKITDVKLFKPGQVKGHEWTNRWKDSVVDDISTWDAPESRVIRVTEGYTGRSVELKVRRFQPLEGDKIDRSWVSGGVKKSVKIPPYAIVDMESAKGAFDDYIRSGLVDCCKRLLGAREKLLWQTYALAIKTVQNPATNEADKRLISSTLDLWMSVRLTTKSFEIVGNDTLDMSRDLIQDQDSPLHGKIPLPPVMGAQIDSVLIHQIQPHLRRRTLEELQKMTQEKKQKTWLTTYLVTFILLHNIALITKHDAEYAKKHGMKRRFAREDNVREYNLGANTLLAYFHYCNKGIYPFSAECKDQDLQSLAELDGEAIDFVKYTRQSASEFQPQWQKLWYDEDLVDEYYYVSQLFEPSWQPRIMV